MAADVVTAAGEPSEGTRTQATGSVNSFSSAIQEHVPTKAEKNEAYVEVDADVDEDAPDVKELPPAIRRVVSLDDDTSLPTLTFRYWLLSTLFVVPGAFLSQISSYRTTYAPYSVFFVQIASNYAGLWLARVLPKRRLCVPFFPNWSFSMNPGPWSVKEHVLITITANSGAISNQGASAISIAELYFNSRLNPAVAIFFMWSIVAVGYAFTCLSRSVLLYDPQYPFFQSLGQVGLFETQRKQNNAPDKTAKKQMRLFWGCFFGLALWQFLPEYVWPMLSSLAIICWFAPSNAKANFIGSGLGGMGFLNFTLDWANVSNYVAGVPLFLSPWWTQVVLFSSFVMCCWILLPAAKFGGLGEYHHGLMTNRLLTANGTKYPVTNLVTADNSFNQTAYDISGPLYLGTQQLWSIFFDYASYTSGYTWVVLFAWPQITAAFQKFKARRNVPGEGINHQYTDRLNVLMRSYPDVPLWWYGLLFLASVVCMVVIVAKGLLFIPIWTYFVALAIGAASIVPLGWLYAVSNYQLPIGTFNELIYGVMVQAAGKNQHSPVGATVYGAIAGDAWYRAQYMLQDQRISHYMHVSQRATFISQLWGLLIGVPVNYGALRWVLDSKREYLDGTVEDPTHIWTGQALVTSLSTSVQYVLIGPNRLFQEKIFRPLPYGFLVGVAAPVVIFTLHKLLPRVKFNLWNTTVFFSGAAQFYGNISTGYLSRFVGGFVVMFWAYRYRYELWSRYNFILAAAFDAGFNLNMLLIFLFFGSGKAVKMPNWWGNNAANVERCFALDT